MAERQKQPDFTPLVHAQQDAIMASVRADAVPMLFEPSDIASCSVDLRYGYTFFTPTYAAIMKHLYGCDIQTGMSLLECITIESDRVAAKSRIDRALAGEYVLAEYPDANNRSSERMFEMIHVPSGSISGIDGVTVVLLDMTSWKERDTILRESQDLLQMVFENTVVGIAIFEQGEGFVQVNDEFCRIAGYSREELIGMTRESLTHPDDRARDRALFEQMVKGEISQYCMEKRYVRKDGSTVHVTVSIECLRKDGAMIDHMLAVVIDNSDRKQAEKALFDAAHEWQMTFDAVSSGIFILDPEMNILRSNRAMTQMLNMKQDELSGKRCCVAIHNMDRPHENCPTLQMQKSRKHASAEIQVGTRWFQVSVDPLLSESGELIGAVHVMTEITERKSDLEKLKQSEVQLADAQKLAHIGSFQESSSLIWSRELYHIFEVPEYLPPLRFDDMCAIAHPADADALAEQREALLSHNIPMNTDFRVVLASGTEKHLHLIAEPLYDEQGRVIGVSGTIMDITGERMAAEEKARDEERLALLLQMSGMQNVSERDLFAWALESIIRLTGSAGGYLFLYDEHTQDISLPVWSETVRQMCKIPAEFPDHCDMAHAGIWADSLRQRTVVIHNNYMAEMNGEGLPAGHFPVMRHLGIPVFDGNRIVAAVGLANKEVPYTDSDVRQIQFFINDMWKIVARRRAEARLAESEAALRSLFESSLDGIFRIGADNRIERVNQAFAGIFGSATSQEMTGRSIVDYLENPAEYSVYLDIMHQKGQVVHYPLHARQVSGKSRLVEVSASVVRNAAGEYVATEGILHDVTDQHLLEEQLRHALKMEAIGRLAGGIAHDFNNILSAIIGFASLPLMTGQASETERTTLHQIIELTERASTLTKGLLAFSRKQVLAMKPVDLNQILQVSAKLLHRLIGEDIRLVVQAGTTPLPVYVDAGQIEQVLMNLATNARDAMPEGGTLTIESMRVSIKDELKHKGVLPGDYALIRMTDTGCGMSPETLAQIFEPFFTTKESGKGTGLGLPSVYGIMQQHRGAVLAESSAGSGTVFSLYLPITREAEDAVGAAALQPVAGGKETLLLVEDDMTLRTITKSILKAHGYTVIEAGDGAEAVALCEEREGRIDMIVSDVIMPVMGGIEAWRAISAQYPAIRIMFMSGYISDEARRAAIEEIGAPFIMKPYEPRSFLAALRKELDHAR